MVRGDLFERCDGYIVSKMLRAVDTGVEVRVDGFTTRAPGAPRGTNGDSLHAVSSDRR